MEPALKLILSALLTAQEALLVLRAIRDTTLQMENASLQTHSAKILMDMELAHHATLDTSSSANNVNQSVLWQICTFTIVNAALKN